ncbi:MAG: IS630 family transposase [Pirellulaceae bacterium]
MAVSTPNQYPVSLTEDQRSRLDEICRNGHSAAKKIRHAQVLLLSDRNSDQGKRSRTEIAALLGMHINTVDRIRKRFVLEGEQPALDRKPRETPPRAAILDGHAEAHLIAICCSDPPEGRTCWTMELLAGELTKRKIVTQISAETVRRALKKNELQPWRKQCWCIPERDHARFVCQMEEVLDVYAEEHTAEEPLICMDEASKQLLCDDKPSIPMEPGKPVREDYHYERRGTQAIFMFFNAESGHRRVSCRDSRTRVDWAEEVRRLLDEDYTHARKVRLVCDNLNTHSKASLYEAFPAAEAHRLARRLEIIHTPRNGSWLNVAEIELSALSRQCLSRRIGTAEELARELKAWEHQRNSERSRVKWKFTVQDARAKLHRLYPQL